MVCQVRQVVRSALARKVGAPVTRDGLVINVGE
jgi:hypothetical protein